ncbi:MAG TPA: hypothetical protein VM911_05800 [Pyrinomonadaceae bacterium]|jgi:hypothetical protein|nr:hypothetical protein [Pyrinomonadaceae bacterium]
MPTKTRKSSGKKSAGKSAASAKMSGENVALASSLLLGPPFADNRPLNGYWSRFPGANNPATCPGFWNAVRHYPTVGGMVAQLGANYGTGSAFCSLSVNYQLNFTAPAWGVYAFLLSLSLGPVTTLHRGGAVYTYGILQLTGPGAPSPMFISNLPSYAGVATTLYAYLQGGARYNLAGGVALQVLNAGYQSYGEIIVNSMAMYAYLPYGVQVAGAMAFDAGIEKQSLAALLNPSEKQVARKTSMAEAIKMGLPDKQ